MSYQLNLDQMLDALVAIGHPRAESWMRAVEAIGTGIALDLAQPLGIRAGVATFQGGAFAGTCVPFYAIYEGQALPTVFAELECDQEDEWGGGLTTMPRASSRVAGSSLPAGAAELLPFAAAPKFSPKAVVSHDR